MVMSLTACGSQESSGGAGVSAGTSSPAGTSAASGEEPTKMTLILRGGAYGESLEASLPAFEEEHNEMCIRDSLGRVPVCSERGLLGRGEMCYDGIYSSRNGASLHSAEYYMD